MSAAPSAVASVLRNRFTRLEVLSPGISDAIHELISRSEDFPANRDIVRRGDRPEQCCVVLAGWVARNKILDNGRRQLTAIQFAGSTPDLQSLFTPIMDHNISTLTSARIGFIAHAKINKLIKDVPDLVRAFWKEALIDASIAREWEINLGSRNAIERIAHLFCETFTRLQAVGEAKSEGGKQTFNWPISQTVLGEAVGLSSVHVNRSLQELRASGLIGPSVRHQVLIQNWEGMVSLSGFNSDYLWLDRPAF